MPFAVTAADDPDDFIASTYFSLRLGLIIVAVALPWALYLWGKSYGVPLQYSMSAYYHADPTGLACPGGHGVARDVFVGGLLAVSALLYAYAGASKFENRMLNVAGILAGGIAFFPMRIPCDGIESRFSPHGIFAITFFLCIAAVAIKVGPSTLDRIKDPKLHAFLKHGYRITGLLMVLAPGSVIAYSLLTGTYAEHTFAIEVTGIYAFAGFWGLKSYEIHHANTHAEEAPPPSIAPELRVRRKKYAV